MKECGAIPDSAEYWWPQYIPKIKRNIKPHDCKPRGGQKGASFRRFCKICDKAFSKNYELKGNHEKS